MVTAQLQKIPLSFLRKMDGGVQPQSFPILPMKNKKDEKRREKKITTAMTKIERFSFFVGPFVSFYSESCFLGWIPIF